MTPEQRTALITACEEGNEVRIITIALQIATAKAFLPSRSALAAMIMDHNCDGWTVADAIEYADRFILANATMPIPKDTSPAATVPR